MASTVSSPVCAEHTRPGSKEPDSLDWDFRTQAESIDMIPYYREDDDWRLPDAIQWGLYAIAWETLEEAEKALCREEGLANYCELDLYRRRQVPVNGDIIALTKTSIHRLEFGIKGGTPHIILQLLINRVRAEQKGTYKSHHKMVSNWSVRENRFKLPWDDPASYRYADQPRNLSEADRFVASRHEMECYLRTHVKEWVQCEEELAPLTLYYALHPNEKRRPSFYEGWEWGVEWVIERMKEVTVKVWDMNLGGTRTRELFPNIPMD